MNIFPPPLFPSSLPLLFPPPPPSSFLYLHGPGDKYWVFKEVTAEPGYPHSLVELSSSLPKDGVDAALRWEPMGKTYFFKGDQYWRYNEEKQDTDPGYPKRIGVWKGIPDSPQGAFISREGCECPNFDSLFLFFSFFFNEMNLNMSLCSVTC